MSDGRTKVLIMGAAGRDFHNFNTFFRDNEDYEVVAFTATQIPYINDRKYPAELAGRLYPDGIPIHDESEISELVKKHHVEQVVFAYSDVPYEYVMHRSALANALGADFVLLGPDKTMVKSTKPVIAVCAVRTGSGKSQTSRKIQTMLREAGRKVVSIRHPMPYGDLVRQRVQRYATVEDLAKNECTIEEMEEYEPHVRAGNVIYAGVDYEAILREAEKEADVILWDGGNNDFSFYKADLYITVADPHRPGNGLVYYPGEVNLRLADVVVLNKIDSADRAGIEAELEAVRSVNPTARIIMGASPVTVDEPEMVRGKRVLVVEDGPTLTHGEMKYGAGTVAARQLGAAEFIDPRPFAAGEIRATFEKYPNIGVLLPAMGYSEQQLKDLETTINASGADVVVIGTPMDLRRVTDIKLPAVQVRYDLQEIGSPTLRDILVEQGFISAGEPAAVATR
jgi:predicted GTPase